MQLTRIGHVRPPRMAPEQLVEVTEGKAAPTQARPIDRAFWARLSGLAGVPMSSATRATPIRDSVLAPKLRLEMIASAKEFIVASTYGITPDDGGVEYLDALVAAAHRGVKVVLAVDANAYAFSKNLAPRMKDLNYRVKALQFYGGHFVPYGDFSEQMARLGAGSHLKLLSIDGKRTLIGGRNIGKNFEKWPDYDVLFQGEIAGRLVSQVASTLLRGNSVQDMALMDRAEGQRHYIADVSWMVRKARVAAESARSKDDNGAKYIALIGDPMARRKQPDAHTNHATQALIAAIDHTTESLVMSSNFMRPFPQMKAALLRARARGVHITVVTTGATGSKLSILPFVDSQDDYAWMKELGIAVIETKQMEHAKLYLFDRDLMAFGSYNIEEHSDIRLTESLVFSNDDALIKAAVTGLSETISRRQESVKDQEKHQPSGFWLTLWLGLQALVARPFI